MVANPVSGGFLVCVIESGSNYQVVCASGIVSLSAHGNCWCPIS